MLALLLAQSAGDATTAFQEISDAADALIGIGEDFIFNTGFILAVLFVIIGFFRYLFNDPKGGQTQVQNSLVGLALLGFSKFIIDLVASISAELKSGGAGENLGPAASHAISGTIIPLLFQWAGSFAVLAIVWGGIQWMTGNVTSGKAWVTNALIGIAGMMLAWVIVLTVSQALGIV